MVDKRLEKVVSDIKGIPLGGVANFGWVWPKDTTIHSSGMCHAQLVTLGPWSDPDKKRKPAELISLFNCIAPFKLTGEKKTIITTFVDWIFNFSPWADAYMDKDVEFAVDNAITFSNPDVAANIVGMSASCTRIFNEHPNIGRTWYELVKAGVHPNVAFVVAHRIYISNDGMVYEHHPTHTGCFNSMLGEGYDYTTDSVKKSPTAEKYALNFIQNKRTQLAKPYREAHASATQTFRVWSGKNEQGESLKIIGALPDILKKASGLEPEKKSSNPFAAAKVAVPKNINKASVDKVMPLLVDHLSQYKEFI